MPIPFGEPLDDRSRERYGRYRSRWSARKATAVGQTGVAHADGFNWVEMTGMSTPIAYPTLYNISVYQVAFTDSGTWTGVPHFKLEVDGERVYPFSVWGEAVTVFGTPIFLRSITANIRAGENLKMWMKSDNAADGAGDWLWAYLYYATFETK